jgi:hypothetical protein
MEGYLLELLDAVSAVFCPVLKIGCIFVCLYVAGVSKSSLAALEVTASLVVASGHVSMHPTLTLGTQLYTTQPATRCVLRAVLCIPSSKPGTAPERNVACSESINVATAYSVPK